MELNTATIEQLDAYRIQVAAILKIDPLMLDYIWMGDQETGLRNRVLYAKRGAAEILRQINGINILSLTPLVDKGWIMFTAIGVNREGRQEIAVGAAYLEGHKMDKLAHAVMTAQTRAVRRLTLQFVGGVGSGILDETEVQAQSDMSGAPAASQAQLAGSPMVIPPVPVAAPPSAPGRDVTPTSSRVAEVLTSQPIAQINDRLPSLVNQAESLPQVYAEGAAALAARPTPPPVLPVADIKPDAVEPKAKVKRTRKTNTVSLASPGQEPAPRPANEFPTGFPVHETPSQVSTPAPAPAPVAFAPVVESAQPAPVQSQVAPPPPVPTRTPAAIPADKNAAFKEKTKLYTQDVLVKGGMLPSDGIGGITMKLRKFAVMNAGVADTTQLTTEQWEELFNLLDGFTAKFGAQALVQYIDKSIGVTK